MSIQLQCKSVKNEVFYWIWHEIYVSVKSKERCCVECFTNKTLSLGQYIGSRSNVWPLVRILCVLFAFACFDFIVSIWLWVCVRACASSIFVHIKGARKFSQSKFIIISIGGTSHHTATNPFCCQLRTIIHCTHGVVVGQESRHKRNTEGFQSVADILTIAWEIIYVPMEKSKPLHASSKYLREIFYFS